MCLGMRKPRGLKVRPYVASFIELNEYLTVFHRGGGLNFCVTELNDILLNSVPNSWSKQAYVKLSYFKYIIFKGAVNMFERI